MVDTIPVSVQLILLCVCVYGPASCHYRFNEGVCTQQEGGTTDGFTFASDITLTPELQVK